MVDGNMTLQEGSGYTVTNGDDKNDGITIIIIIREKDSYDGQLKQMKQYTIIIDTICTDHRPISVRLISPLDPLLLLLQTNNPSKQANNL